MGGRGAAVGGKVSHRAFSHPSGSNLLMDLFIINIIGSTSWPAEEQ